MARESKASAAASRRARSRASPATATASSRSESSKAAPMLFATASASARRAALLDSLRDEAVAVAGEARDLARRLAAADALLSLAIVAAERGWTMPQVDD